MSNLILSSKKRTLCYDLHKRDLVYNKKNHSCWIKQICCSPLGDRFITLSEKDNNVCVWQTSTGKMIRKIRVGSKYNPVCCVSWLNNIIVSTYNNITLIDPTTYKMVFSIFDRCDMSSIAVCPTKPTTIAIGYYDGILAIRKSGNYKRVLDDIKNNPKNVHTSIEFSLSGKYLALTNSIFIKLWHVNTELCINTFNVTFTTINRMRWGYDDKLAVLCDSQIKVWNNEDNDLKLVMRNIDHYDVNGLEWSNYGTKIYIASDTGLYEFSLSEKRKRCLLDKKIINICRTESSKYKAIETFLLGLESGYES